MMSKIPQIKKQPGIAPALSGRATKAFYCHLGVLKVLQPENITPIVGSSTIYEKRGDNERFS